MREVAGALERLIAALDKQGIEYMLVGSLASSIHGIERRTRDIDLAATIGPGQTTSLAADLSGEFYIDAEAASEALQRGRSFNVIHLASAYKFDIFPLRDDAYSRAQIGSSQSQPITFAEGVMVRCPVATPEDIILAKLWYRLGGEQSDQRWNDLRGVREVQRGKLDEPYHEEMGRSFARGRSSRAPLWRGDLM